MYFYTLYRLIKVQGYFNPSYLTDFTKIQIQHISLETQTKTEFVAAECSYF